MSANHAVAIRRRLSTLFDDRPGAGRVTQLFNIALAALIVVNVGGVVLESVEPIAARYDTMLRAIEWIATILFGVEYVLRVWTVVDLGETRFAEPVRGRLRYVASFSALIDLVAVLPAILGLFGAGDLRVLRLLRLLRMLKLSRHATIFELLWAVFRDEARSIAAVVFILLLTLTMGGALMYMIEGDAQPRLFSSIPASMWWAIETLTTVGYGDMVPVTPLGRVLGGLMSVIGVAVLALFSGLITVSFMEQLKLRRALLQRAIDGRISDGPMAEADFRAFARIGERLGLPESDVAGAILSALAESSTVTCPHCGYPITEHRPLATRPARAGK